MIDIGLVNTFFMQEMLTIQSLFWRLPFTGRGGQSALRFARLRMEKRHNYVRKVAETAVQMFITNDKSNVAGLVLAGSADFKTELSQSDMFDPVRIVTFMQTSILFSYVITFSWCFNHYVLFCCAALTS